MFTFEKMMPLCQRRIEGDPTGLLLEGFRYRDLETGVFITRDPLGAASVAEEEEEAETVVHGDIMMPKEKWMVHGKAVTEGEYQAALEPSSPQVGAGPVKTAKNTGEEADMHTAVASGEQEIPGQKSCYHTAAARFPNLYTYCNENPWTFFDPEGLDVDVPKKEDRPIVLKDLQKTFKGTLSFDDSGKLSRTKTTPDTNYDKMLDRLISSKDKYTIDPNGGTGHYTHNTKSGKPTYTGSDQSDIARGGTISYGDGSFIYKQNPFRGLTDPLYIDSTNRASTLGHEIARAYSHDKGEPQTNDSVQKEKTVERANEAYTRQEMNPRTSY